MSPELAVWLCVAGIAGVALLIAGALLSVALRPWTPPSLDEREDAARGRK